MKRVDMYEIGEQVLIKASVIDVMVEQGKLKYKLRVEHTNDELEHPFSEGQIIPADFIVPRKIDKALGSKVASGELYPGEFEQREES